MERGFFIQSLFLNYVNLKLWEKLIMIKITLIMKDFGGIIDRVELLLAFIFFSKLINPNECYILSRSIKSFSSCRTLGVQYWFSSSINLLNVKNDNLAINATNFYKENPFPHKFWLFDSKIFGNSLFLVNYLIGVSSIS